MHFKNIAVIMCPPYPEFIEQPKDVSPCTLEICPLCEGQMWYSEKKKTMHNVCKQLGKDILFGCFHCIKERITTDPNFQASDFRQVNI